MAPRPAVKLAGVRHTILQKHKHNINDIEIEIKSKGTRRIFWKGSAEKDRARSK